MEKKFRGKGILLVLSSPSGAGKSSLARKLVSHDNSLQISVSVTTRPKRRGEKEGKDYYFVSETEFDRMASAGEFLEFANVFGYKYGTLKKTVEDSLANVKDVLFDIEWQGARILKSRMPENIVSVYILPPSMKELRTRLTRRSQDSQEVIDSRMERAFNEARHYKEYDYVIINKDFEDSYRKLQSIITAERFKTHRQPYLKEFINSL
jgi:guanylate kinase